MVDKKILISKALAARENAHAPYSDHPVGAALFTDKGNYFSGSNVENAAHPSGQCAEATAIGSMVTEGGGTITDILVVGPGDKLCPPCGDCRQRIKEFGSKNTMVHMAIENEIVKSMTLDDLLPLAFSSDNRTKQTK